MADIQVELTQPNGLKVVANGNSAESIRAELTNLLGHNPFGSDGSQPDGTGKQTQPDGTGKQKGKTNGGGRKARSRKKPEPDPDKGQEPDPDKGQEPDPDKGQEPDPDKGQEPDPDKGQEPDPEPKSDSSDDTATYEQVRDKAAELVDAVGMEAARRVLTDKLGVTKLKKLEQGQYEAALKMLQEAIDAAGQE